MLLSNSQSRFPIPFTSTCVIHTIGELRDGDTVSITSPVFSSTSFTTRELNMSDRFEVPLRITNGATVTSQGELDATLVCDDDDIFHMYARV